MRKTSDNILLYKKEVAIKSFKNVNIMTDKGKHLETTER